MTEDDIGKVTRRVWLKRAFYLSMAGLVLIGVPFFLTWFVNASGMANFSDIFGGLVLWNELSGRSFVVAFIAIIIMTGLIMYFMMKAFDSGEGAW